jgi:hypothetical protein
MLMKCSMPFRLSGKSMLECVGQHSLSVSGSEFMAEEECPHFSTVSFSILAQGDRALGRDRAVMRQDDQQRRVGFDAERPCSAVWQR